MDDLWYSHSLAKVRMPPPPLPLSPSLDRAFPTGVLVDAGSTGVSLLSLWSKQVADRGTPGLRFLSLSETFSHSGSTR